MKKKTSSFIQSNSNTQSRHLAASILLACASIAHADTTLNVSQELTLTTTPAVPSFGLRADGVIYNAGPRTAGDYPLIDLSTVTSDSNGNISTFLWDAGRTAFRVGLFQSDSLNPWAFGAHSFAYGYRTVAAGTASLAGGLLTSSPGYGSVALGGGSVATGTFAFAVGDHATAVESDTFAAGAGATAVTHASAAFNYGTCTLGFSSFAAGFYTSADSFASFVIGTWNVGGYSSPNGNWEWNAQDPVFEIGNGTAPQNRSNALTVYKSGNATFQGVVQVAPGGDIPMFNASAP